MYQSSVASTSGKAKLLHPVRDVLGPLAPRSSLCDLKKNSGATERRTRTVLSVRRVPLFGAASILSTKQNAAQTIAAPDGNREPDPAPSPQPPWGWRDQPPGYTRLFKREVLSRSHLSPFLGVSIPACDRTCGRVRPTGPVQAPPTLGSALLVLASLRSKNSLILRSC